MPRGVQIHAECLEKIIIRFPHVLQGLVRQLTLFLDASLVRTDGGIAAKPSNKRYLPTVSLSCDSDEDFAKADFSLSSHETVSVFIRDITGVVRRNPSAYRRLPLTEVRDRFTGNGIEIQGIDHIGFNLPWFDRGLHPVIADLRQRLKTLCLYHRFPTGEPWDFIIPGEVDEIRGSKTIDYDKVRKPKFEIVSFDKSSTPLVQIDVAVAVTHEQFSSLFPEALNDMSMKNIWVYVETQCDLDICLVINEKSLRDWTPFFRGHRIA